MFPYDPGRHESPTPKKNQTKKNTEESSKKNVQMELDDNNQTGDKDSPCESTADRCGILRYFQVVDNSKKRKRADQTKSGDASTQRNNSKISLSNRFSSLPIEDEEPRKAKPPPIYIREKSSRGLDATLKTIIKQEHYMVDLSRGALKETKVQVSDPTDFTTLTNWLDTNKKEFYTYQNKTQKGLRVIIKGIDHEVKPEDIKEDLERQHFKVNWVFNVLNRFKQPQPMFKVELMPDTNKLPKGKVHPIYEIKYVLQRKVTVDEPYKRKGPVQCMNCQEFGHTKRYCKLKATCVACGGNHSSADCTTNKDDPFSKKCSNCGGNHTANYRGCPVYVAMNQNTKPVKYVITKPAPNPFDASNFPSLPAKTFQNWNQTCPNLTNYVNSSFADSLKNTQPQQASGNTDNLTQMLLMLVSNIQQLTTQMQQMQKLQERQMELIAKLIKP